MPPPATDGPLMVSPLLPGAPVRPVESRGPKNVTDPATPSPLGWAVAVAAFLLCVADLPGLSTSEWAPKMAVLVVLGAAGIPVLIARAIGRHPGARSVHECWAARAALGFVGAATISTLLATSTLSALVGRYDQGTGLIFVVALTGCWAIGTGLMEADRRILVTALITGAVVNAVVALLQQIVGLGRLDIPTYYGIASGLLGNPIYLGALLAGALALLGPRFAAGNRRYGPAIALVGVALGVSGERLPAILALFVVGYELWTGRRGTESAGRRPSLVFAGLAVGGIVAGSVLTRLVGTGGGLGSRVAASSTGETFGQRLDGWEAGLRAIAHRPVFGYGPGQFQAATQGRFPPSYWHQFAGVFFTDSHNFVIEYATTTGLVGLALLVCWLVLALVGRRGPLLIFAIVLLACELAEPLNVPITPLALLALGAAGVVGDPPGVPFPPWLKRSVVIFAIVALLPAGALVVGDAALQRGSSQYQVAQIDSALRSSRTANTLLAPFPDPAELLSQVQAYRALDFKPGALQLAVDWAKVAVQRNPTDPGAWLDLANAQLRADRVDGAHASASMAAQLSPWNTSANNVLGDIALWQHHQDQADKWFDRSLKIDPDQPVVRKEQQGRCVPRRPWERGFSGSCALGPG